MVLTHTNAALEGHILLTTISEMPAHFFNHARIASAEDSDNHVWNRRLHQDHRHRGGRGLLLEPQGAGGEGSHQGPLQDALLHQDHRREHAQTQGRGGRHRRRRHRRRILEPRGQRRRGHPLDARQGPPPGPDRRSGRGRSRIHARSRGRDGQGPRAHQPHGPRRPGHRPLPDHRLRRQGRRPGAQREAGLREEQREVRPVQMGAEIPPQLPRGAFRERHLPPGQPGVPVPPRPRGREGWEEDRLPRLLLRNRLPHHPDRRPRSRRMGSGRYRGGGRHGRPAQLHAPARRRRIQTRREAQGGCERHRPRPHRGPHAEEEGGRRQVRGVLRTRIQGPPPAGQVHHRQHGPRVRSNHGILPSGREDHGVPPPDRKGREAHRRRREVPEGADHVVRLRAGVHRHPGARPVHRRALPRRLQAPPGPHPHEGDEGEVRRDPGRPRREGAEEARRGNPRRRIARHRIDHILHEHGQPLGHARSRTRGQEGLRPGPQAQGVGQDLPVPGIQGCHPVPPGLRAADLPPEDGLPGMRIRMHDLHREQRTPVRRGLQLDQGQRPGRGRGRFEQQELRREDPPPGQGQLPDLPSPGRRLLHRRKGRHRP